MENYGTKELIKWRKEARIKKLEKRLLRGKIRKEEIEELKSLKK